MKKFGSQTLVSATCCLLVVLLSSLAPASAQSKLDEIRKSGTIRVAIAVEPPFAYFDSSGNVTGAAPEVLRAVIKKLGVNNIQAIVTDWGAMIPGLQARRFDVIATGLFMRPKRCESVLYSQPDLCTAHAFAVKKGNPLGLTDVMALKTKGAKLGTCGGCFLDVEARKVGVPSENIFATTDPLSGLQMLKSGRVDALGYPDNTLENAIHTTGTTGVDIIAPLKGESVECSGVAFNPEDKALRDAYDKALAELKSSGEFANIVKKWNFNAQYAIDNTREKFCSAAK